MLRYYSYYSVGGYKDFILGTSEEKQEATYYLPLLPVLEERAKTDEDAAKLFDQQKIFLKYNSCQLSSHSVSQRLQEFFFTCRI